MHPAPLRTMADDPPPAAPGPAGSDPEGPGHGDDPASEGTDGSGAGEGSDRSSGGGTRPWYRRGTVWAWFALGAAIGGWVLAGVAEDRLYSFDPGPDEVEAVCPVAAPLQEVAAWGERSLGEPVDGERLATLDALVEVVPSSVAGDVREVRAAEAERQAVLLAADLSNPEGRQRARDAVDALEDEHAVALRRVDAYVEAACGYPVIVGRVVLG